MKSKLIAMLIEIQTMVPLNDKEMAERLGCSRQLWQMTRTGKISLSNTMLKCISRNYPDLHEEVIKFLAKDGDGLGKHDAQNPLSQHSQAQGRGLKRFFVELLGRIRK